jgi:hypothetical protein
MSIATVSNLEIAPARPLLMPLVSAAACVALADWLFLDLPINVWNWRVDLAGWQIGISLPLFLGTLGVIAVACNGARAVRKTQIIMTGVFVAGLFALVEDVDFLSTIVGALATSMFVIVMTSSETSRWKNQLFEAATFPFAVHFDWPAMCSVRCGTWKHGLRDGWVRSLPGWFH